MKKYWQLFWLFRKFPLMRHLEYRTDFFFWSLVSGMWAIFNFFFFSLIINVNNGIGGWSAPEMYLLVSTFTIVDAFLWSFFHHNMRKYSSDVFSGEFSKLLVKPIDPQFAIMTQENSYSNVFRLAIGVGMLLYSLNLLDYNPSFFDVIMYLLSLFFAMMSIYFLWFILTTFSFWVERLDNINEIIPSLKSIYQVPHTVYQGALSTIFTVIIPIALTASVPSKALLGEYQYYLIARLIIFTIIIGVISRIFFNISIKKYSSIGG